MKAPSLYAFNHEVIIDIFYSHDMMGDVFGFLSVVCIGTTFHVIVLICEGKGQPKSIKCFAKFESRWTSWAGFPQVVSTDRGLHNRGELAKGLASKGLASNGIYIRQAATEAPEHIGRGERHGGIVKAMLANVVREHHVVGKAQMKQAAAVVQECKNDTFRRGGFSPSQWVLGKYPRRPGSMLEEQEWGQLGVLQSQQDSGTAFGIKARMRCPVWTPLRTHRSSINANNENN